MSQLLFFATEVQSQGVKLSLAEAPPEPTIDKKGQFIAGFEWSVDRSNEFIWPFQSMRPASYDAVWMVVEKMPRVWPENGKAIESVGLSAYRALRVNSRALPKPKRISGSYEAFRVTLQNGRLHFSFLLPARSRLDSSSTIVRIKLYKVDDADDERR